MFGFIGDSHALFSVDIAKKNVSIDESFSLSGIEKAKNWLENNKNAKLVVHMPAIGCERDKITSAFSGLRDRIIAIEDGIIQTGAPKPLLTPIFENNYVMINGESLIKMIKMITKDILLD